MFYGFIEDGVYTVVERCMYGATNNVGNLVNIILFQNDIIIVKDGKYRKGLTLSLYGEM